MKEKENKRNKKILEQGFPFVVWSQWPVKSQ